MKHVRVQFIVLSVIIVSVSSLLALALSTIIGRLYVPRENFRTVVLFSLALREFLMPLFCVVISTAIISFTSKRALSPIMALTRATKRIASGDFDVRIEENGRKDEIGQLQHNFNLMAKELKGNEFLRKDFISNVSHEFKTPLSVIHGYVKLFERQDITLEECREYAAVIDKESERLIRLSSNILRLSKLENQEILDSASPFPLDEQLRRVVVFLQPQWSRKKIEFDIELLPMAYTGNGDMLWQVWMNLLENAIKFSHESGRIRVRLYPVGGCARIEIIDDGIGMQAETQARIFEQFYQGEHSHTGEGNGLGLSLVKRIVDLHGGSVAVHSEPGKGSEFVVQLPFSAERRTYRS